MRDRHFVKIVAGKDSLTFEGTETTWEKLPALLEKVPDREQTVLEIAIASNELSAGLRDEAEGNALRMARRFGFEYLSNVGVHPLGSKGSPSQKVAAPAKNQNAEADVAKPVAYLPQGKVEPVPFTVVKSLRLGDSITITEVQATSPDLKNGDKVIVYGRYTLASEPKASLCLFATSAESSSPSNIRSEQRIYITKGEGKFELSETLDCKGYLHVSFYSDPASKGFGVVYFGTAQQMKEIEPWDVPSWYTSGTPAASDAVVEGVGWSGFRVGATREQLSKAFGPLEPTPTPGSQWTGWVTRHHIDCWFDQAGRAVEVRFNEGFNLPLTSGVKIGSPEKDVLAAYGSPDRVVNKPQSKMLEYGKRGVLMWIVDGKVFDFTVFKPHEPLDGTETGHSRSGNELTNQQMKARKRMQQDLRAFSDQERREIESLYQVANRKWRTQEARDSLKTLVREVQESKSHGLCHPLSRPNEPGR